MIKVTAAGTTINNSNGEVRPKRNQPNSKRIAMLRLLFIAVACDGAYMGATTNVPQQLALGTPLSCRAAPAVAVIPKIRPKQTPWYEKEVYKSPRQRQMCAAAPVPAHT